MKNSVISLSGQTWKLVLAVLALLIGSFAPLYPAIGIDWTSGTIIAIAGYAFGLVTIRCDECKNLWLWEATKGTAPYGPLFKRGKCPKCKHDYGHAH